MKTGQATTWARRILALAGASIPMSACDRGSPEKPAAFDHQSSAESHWVRGPSQGDPSGGQSIDLGSLWPAPESIDEPTIARHDRTLKMRRAAAAAAIRHRADAPSDTPADEATQRGLDEQRRRLAQMGAPLDLSDEDLGLLHEWSEAKALMDESLWAMGDPDGDGAIDPPGAAGFLQYLGDFAAQHETRAILAFDLDADGVLSAHEAERAQERLRQELAVFERMRGVDIDLDGVVGPNEAEIYLRNYQRGETTADLDADGIVGPKDIERYLAAVGG